MRHPRILLYGLLGAVLALTPSCSFLAGAAVGAGTMYVLGEDSTERYLSVGLDELYAAARDELQERGEVQIEDPGADEAYLRARIDDHEVQVFLTAATDEATRMVVKARRWASVAPDLAEAERLSDRITRRAGG